MAKYTEQIDAQITQLLQVRGEVTPEMIAGVTDEEAHAFLDFYASSHPEKDLSFANGILGPVSADAPADASARSEPSEVAVEPAADAQGLAGDGWTEEQVRQAEHAAQERGLDFEPASAEGFAGNADSNVPVEPSGGYGQTPPGAGPATGNDPFANLDITPEPRTQPVSGWLWLLVFFAAPLGAIAAWFIARDKNRSIANTMLVVGLVFAVLQACFGFMIGGTLGGMGGMSLSNPTGTTWPANGHLTFYYFGLPG